MSDRDPMQLVLGEFGKSIGLDDLALDEEGWCALLIDEALVVNMQVDEAGDRLLLYCSLGEPGGDPSAAYRALLRANYLGRETGGAVLGLRPEGGEVVLSEWLPTRGLELAGFSKAVERFVSCADTWRGRLPALGEDGTAPPEPAATFPGMRA